MLRAPPLRLGIQDVARPSLLRGAELRKVPLPVAVDPRNRQAVHQRGTGDDCLDSPRTRAHGEEHVWGCESNALSSVMLDFSYICMLT